MRRMARSSHSRPTETLSGPGLWGIRCDSRSAGSAAVVGCWRGWLRAVRLRQEAGALAATRRRPAADGVPLLHAGRLVDAGNRSPDLRRLVVRTAHRLL